MALTLAIEDGHVPFEVTAVLRTGAGWDLPYGLDLAGLIASHLRDVQQAALEEEGQHLRRPLADTTEEVAYDLKLPLSRCFTGADWHWLATCAIAVAPDEDPESRVFYRTVDSSYVERAAIRPLPYFSPKSGPYHDVMMTAAVITTAAVVWRGVGDIAAVRAALVPNRFIGRRRNTGEGRVLEWRVAEVHGVDPGRFAHVDHDAAILRPVPRECAEALGVPYRTGWYAVRPPSWHPDRLAELAMTAEPDDESWFD